MPPGLQFLFPDWQAPPGVRVVSTTRHGGFSAPPCDSLNFGQHVSDAPEAVQSNRRLLRQAAELPSEPRWLDQVHGTQVIDLDSQQSERRGDAAISSKSGSVCVVMTADCLPVVLASADGAVVGVAHAGWRGLAAGVIESTVAAMRRKTAPSTVIQAGLAPAISAANFEVGEEVRAAFTRVDSNASSAFTLNSQGRWQCDLYQLARQRLNSIGIDRISGGDHCTYADEGNFFSHRRDVQHRKLSSTGRMATLIWRT